MNHVEIKKTFIRELSGLIDDYSKDNYELMTVLEDFTRDILVLVDSCRTDLPSFFMGTHDEGGCIFSGNLHHDILSCRGGKNPLRRAETKNCIRNYLKDIRAKNAHHSSSSRSLNHHSSNSSSIDSCI